MIYWVHLVGQVFNQIESNTKYNAIDKNIFNIRWKVLLDNQVYLKTSWDKFMSGDIRIHRAHGVRILSEKNVHI